MGLLALEGPDYEQGKETMRQGCLSLLETYQVWPTSTIELGNFHIRLGSASINEVRIMLDRLLRMVDAASEACPEAASLLAHYCRMKPVDDDSLQFLGCVQALNQPTVTALLLKIYGPQGTIRSSRMSAIMRLIGTLRHPTCRTLRNFIASFLVEEISKTLNFLQAKLWAQLQAGQSWTGLDLEIQAMGEWLKCVEWILPLLDESLKQLLDVWPTAKELKSLHDMRITAHRDSPEMSSSFCANIDWYCTTRLVVHRKDAEPHAIKLVESLLNIWSSSTDDDLRLVALLVAQGRCETVGDGTNVDFCSHIITQLPTLPKDIVLSLKSCIQCWETDPDAACVDLAFLLSGDSASAFLEGWKQVLRRMLRKRGLELVNYSATHMRTKRWLEWLQTLQSIFTNLQSLFVESNIDDETLLEGWTPLLHPALHSWAITLERFQPLLSRLEDELGPGGTAMRCFLVARQGQLSDVLERILSLLAHYEDKQFWPTMVVITALLDDSKALEVNKALSSLTRTSPIGIEACNNIITYNKKSSKLLDAIFSGWSSSPTLTIADKNALEAIAVVLNIERSADEDLSLTKFTAAADYIELQYSILLAEAQRLEIMRRALKAKDPQGMSAIFASAGIEDSSPLEEALDSLPLALVDVVEQVGELEVEIQFPLTHLTALQRAAMGVDNAQSLLLRFSIGDFGLPPGFCLHLDDESKGTANIDGHYPVIVFDDNVSNWETCHGRSTRAKHQVSRALGQHLTKGFDSIQDVHDVVVKSLKDLADSCMVCGSYHGTHMRRSTICSLSTCISKYNLLSLEIQLADIRTDPVVVDLLLTMVHAAALTGNMAFLPGCPIKDTASIISLLNHQIPPVATLQTLSDLSPYHSGLSKSAIEFLVWTCHQYRGFLSSATGPLKIPSLPPNTQQFLLANASPALESAFASRIGSAPTQVVFHGTSLDRLFPILVQGLKICSGNTLLQRNGAVFGNGIYVSDSTLTAWGYSPVPPASNTGWRNSTLSGMRVLLGCELAGDQKPHSVGNDIFVVADESAIMVRYIFLMKGTTSMVPISGHLVPAMKSVFASLKSGAL